MVQLHTKFVREDWNRELVCSDNGSSYQAIGALFRRKSNLRRNDWRNWHNDAHNGLLNWHKKKPCKTMSVLIIVLFLENDTPTTAHGLLLGTSTRYIFGHVSARGWLSIEIDVLFLDAQRHLTTQQHGVPPTIPLASLPQYTKHFSGSLVSSILRILPE